jgi:uncharacterized protein
MIDPSRTRLADEAGEDTEIIHRNAEKRRLVLFFALAFVASWLLWMPLVASSRNWIAGPAPFLLFYLGAAGPALAAIVLSGLDHGKRGVWSLLSRLAVWRVHPKWYLIALLLPGAVRFIAFALLYLSGYVRSDVSFRKWPELVGIFLLMLILVPLEELGWRGYALPKLQKISGAIRASLILGIMWSFWHLPLVWVKGSYQESPSPSTYILIFTVSILPISVLFTWLYNRTKGSLLHASIFHAAINLTESALIIRESEGILVILTASVLYSAMVCAVVAFRSLETAPVGRR